MPNSLNASGSLEALRYRLDAILHEIEAVPGGVSQALLAAKATINSAAAHIENHFKAEIAAFEANMDGPTRKTPCSRPPSPPSAPRTEPEPMAKKWTDHEYEILDRVYPTDGTVGVHALLPHRSRGVIKVIAHNRGIKANDGVRTRPRFLHEAVIAAMAANSWCVKIAAHVVGCCECTVRDAMNRQHAMDRAAAQARAAERRASCAPAQQSVSV